MPRSAPVVDKKPETKSILDLPPGVRRYDFRTPRKLSPAQRLRLGAIYSKLAPKMAELFRELLQSPGVETTFLGLEQVQAAAWINAEATDVIVCEAELKPGPGRFYVSWPRRLAFFLLEKLLGGTGDELFIDQELSDIETGILWKITDSVVQELKAGWNQKGFQTAGCVRFLENMKAFTEACGPEILLIAGLTVHIEPVQGRLGIIFPYSVVKSWLEDPAGEPAPAVEAPQTVKPGSLAPALASAFCTLTARLQDTPIRISDFMNLQAGDCLQLNHPTLNPVDLYVNGRLKFQGYIGLKGKQLAVKITAVVNQTGGGGNLHGSGKS